MTDPQAPVVVAFEDGLGGRDLAILQNGGLAFIIDHAQSFVRVIDIDQPSSPVQVGTWTRLGENYFRAVGADEHYAYVGV